jgi:hypothetical protein
VLQTIGETPPGGDPQGASFAHAPAMLALTHLSRHVIQNPNPQQQATATGPSYHNTRHTTHDTPNYDRLRPWSRDTAHGPTAPTAPNTLRHLTRLSPQRSWAWPGHTSAPCTSQAHSTQGKSQRLPTPMHQPGTPHASADGAPRPFPCHAAPT